VVPPRAGEEHHDVQEQELEKNSLSNKVQNIKGKMSNFHELNSILLANGPEGSKVPGQDGAQVVARGVHAQCQEGEEGGHGDGRDEGGAGHVQQEGECQLGPQAAEHTSVKEWNGQGYVLGGGAWHDRAGVQHEQEAEGLHDVADGDRGVQDGRAHGGKTDIGGRPDGGRGNRKVLKARRGSSSSGQKM
jgi:hypothetical protein